MTPVIEYLQLANECLRWADSAEAKDQRKAFLEMARAWTQGALLAQGTTIPESDDEIDIRRRSPSCSERTTQYKLTSASAISGGKIHQKRAWPMIKPVKLIAHGPNGQSFQTRQPPQAASRFDLKIRTFVEKQRH
jgi:hypothetical protein